MTHSFRPCPKPPPRPRKARLPVNPVNKERAARRFGRDYGAAGDWIRLQPCALTGAYTGQWVFDPFEQRQVRVQVVASHFPSRGAGGRSQNLVPLAWHLEIRSHREKSKLQAEYGVNLAELAKVYAARFEKEQSRRAP